MNWFLRQGDKERGRQGETRVASEPPYLLVSLSPCLRSLVIGAALLVAGCASDDSQPTPPPVSRASVALRVLVVNEPELAAAIERLRGEWAERLGGSLTAEAKPWSEVAAADSLDADVILFPSRYMGELCTRGWLRPVRSNVLEDAEFNADDIFPLVRRKLINWGGQTMALPLGVDLPVMCFRVERFEWVHRRPPETWKDYGQQILPENAPKIEQPSSTLPATWEPFYTWSAPLLLVRVASYSAPADGSVLFDPKSMKPRITEPPFVRALTELSQVDSFKRIGDPRDDSDRKLREPEAASWQVATGYAMFTAIGLPPSGHRRIVREHAKLAPSDGSERIGWMQLPGTLEHYDSALQSWEHESSIRRVPLLGVGDRLIAVTASSRNAASSFKLLAWLASAEVSSQLARTGAGTMPVRKSLATAPAWYDSKLNSPERSQLGGLLGTALASPQHLLVPRIPGIDEYLGTIDKAVQDVVLLKNTDPQSALKRAAQEWEAITNRLGREKQREAYLKHLNISEP